MLSDDAILIDIARAARLIIEFKRGMDQAAFLADLKTQAAILHEFMVLEPVMNWATDGGLEPSSDRTPTSRILVSWGSDASS